MTFNIISFAAFKEKRRIARLKTTTTPSAFFDLTEEERQYFAHMFSDPELDILAFSIGEDMHSRVLDPDEFPEHPFAGLSIDIGGESS
jgi:hypothetical protein